MSAYGPVRGDRVELYAREAIHTKTIFLSGGRPTVSLMNTEGDGSVINSFRDFLAALELEDAGDLASFLDDEFEPFISWVDITNGDSKHPDAGLEIIVFHSYLDNARLDLDYPFTLEDWREQMDWLANLQRAHCQMWEAIHDEATLGAPDREADITEQVAGWLRVSPEEFQALLGGRWIWIGGPEQDHVGKRIHGWFTPEGASPRLAMGFGGDAVYIEPLAHADSQVSGVPEWPAPQCEGPYYGELFEDFQEHSHDTLLKQISSGLTLLRSPDAVPHEEAGR